MQQAEVHGRPGGSKKHSARDGGSSGGDHGRNERAEAGVPDAASGSSTAARPDDRVGLEMEIQGCDPAVCDGLCRACPWERCTILADHGGVCDVRVLSDEAEYFGVANRYLRMPTRGAPGKRRRNAES